MTKTGWQRILQSIVIIALIFGIAACNNGTGERGTNGMPSSKPDNSSPAASNDAAADPVKPMPVPDPNKQSTVVFSMYEYDPYYEDAKKAYEQEHPNTTIDLRYVTKEFDSSGLLVEKFRTKTAAEFLNGKGADLIVMDDLPVDHYIGNDLLTNLNEWMDGDPAYRKIDYFQNLLDHVKQSDGSVYAVPLSFYLTGVLADVDVIHDTGLQFDDSSWTWEQFGGLVQKFPLADQQKYGYFERGKTNMLWRLVTSSYSQFVDEVNRKANFESDAFIGLLNRINQLEAEKIVTFDGKNLINGKVYFQPSEMYSLSDYRTRLNESKLANPRLYQMPKSEGQQDGGFYAPLANIAINVNSNVKPEAWDFLKFLMSGKGKTSAKELTDSSWYSVFPVSKSAFEARALEAKKEGRINDAEIQMLSELIGKVVNPIVMLPGEIELMLFQETPAFFSGQKSAEAVAALLQNKATTYLNE
ncbi:ABC transporter substrate-binding protein [Paenibacillus sp. CF384]|uniref:ABC transporter substrate-binding protein n=1 Tax=Paenibacillus sp. CF384 TaxID=1884382 RepID=UPI0015A709CA|nr:extracellular solute-binding protein [Paenibacillus sp. CF384]